MTLGSPVKNISSGNISNISGGNNITNAKTVGATTKSKVRPQAIPIPVQQIPATVVTALASNPAVTVAPTTQTSVTPSSSHCRV